MVSILKHVSEELHLAPKIMVHQPFHQFTHGLGPRLIVEHPEHATCLPCRHQRAMRHLKQYVIISQIGQCCHICSQLVGQFVQRADDVAAFAEVKACQIHVQLLVELVRELSQSGDTPFAIATRFIRKNHASEGAVSQFVFIELAG